jgi:hypothetical protein
MEQMINSSHQHTNSTKSNEAVVFLDNSYVQNEIEL